MWLTVDFFIARKQGSMIKTFIVKGLWLVLLEYPTKKSHPTKSKILSLINSTVVPGFQVNNVKFAMTRNAPAKLEL